jgi:hypothetical protein
MTRKPKVKRLSISVMEEHAQWLAHEKKRTGLSFSAQLRVLLDNHMCSELVGAVHEIIRDAKKEDLQTAGVVYKKIPVSETEDGISVEVTLTHRQHVYKAWATGATVTSTISRGPFCTDPGDYMGAQGGNHRCSLCVRSNSMSFLSMSVDEQCWAMLKNQSGGVEFKVRFPPASNAPASVVTGIGAVTVIGSAKTYDGDPTRICMLGVRAYCGELTVKIEEADELLPGASDDA